MEIGCIDNYFEGRELMKLIENGVFTIPLYHGTSTLFIDSIEKTGLGGEDPLGELGARDFFDDLWEFAQRKIGRDESYRKDLDEISFYANQGYLEGSYNYRHGESYLTIGDELGVKYALECNFGSEYLHYMWRLYALMKAGKVDGVEAFEERTILQVLLKEPYYPILITLNKVKLEDVVTETGKPMQEQLEEIEEYMRIGRVSPLSFKLVSPIHKENFSVTKSPKHYC